MMIQIIMMYILIFLIVFGGILLPKYLMYMGSNYHTASGNRFFKTIFNKGNYGEFLTFSYLEKLKTHQRLLTNLYIPKKDGSTTEIDLVLLSETGIYVFESKNYSGWIFGDEKSKNWMQTLQNKQKNRFFNPIWQNNGHINALKSIVELDDKCFKSYIIFSERCTLKKINITSPNVKVLKRNDLIKMIKKDIESSPKLMTVLEVDTIYTNLQKYTNASETVKQAHIDHIQMNR